MNRLWQQHLEHCGAQLDDQGAATSFGDYHQQKQGASESALLADLDPLGVLRVSGGDAGTFLQAQLSSDILRAGPQRSTPSAWCDAKGRALALPTVMPDDDAFLLLLPRSLMPATHKRLKLFVLRADVQLEDVSDNRVRLGLFGPNAAAALDALLDVPEPGCVSATHDITAMCFPGSSPRYLLLCSPQQAIAVWDQLTGSAQPVGYPRWQLQTINAGRPTLHPETAGQFVPQMLNLHWLGGIDFAKGCYPGQEIIARLQHRGTLKQRVYRIRTAADTAIAPGEHVTDAQGHKQGTILSAAPDDGGQTALAVLRTDSASAPLTVDGRVVSLLDLPYRTPE